MSWRRVSDAEWGPEDVGPVVGRYEDRDGHRLAVVLIEPGGPDLIAMTARDDGTWGPCPRVPLAVAGHYAELVREARQLQASVRQEARKRSRISVHGRGGS